MAIMNEIRLFEHTTSGGARYLTTVKDDLSTAIVRLDGDPVFLDRDGKKITMETIVAFDTWLLYKADIDGDERITIIENVMQYLQADING